MSDFAHQIIRWTAIAALVGMVVGAAGLCGQAVALAFGGKEATVLIGAFLTLATASLTTLGGLAAAVWSREQKKE